MDDGLRLLLDGAIPFALRLNREFRHLDVREGVVLPGPIGWGEFAPFDDYTPEQAGRWLASALEAAYIGWPAPRREAVQVNAIIPARDPRDCAHLVAQAIDVHGCTVVKIPVGSHDLDIDIAMVDAARSALDSRLGVGVGRIRVDAKGAWSDIEAATALRELATFGLEYVEQPCSGEDHLRALRRMIDVPIAVDESIRVPGRVDPRRIRECADIALLKPAPLGGVRATVQLADALEMTVVVSGSLDSSVGLGVSLAAAAALPDVHLACGLGTGVLLVDDLVSHTLLPVSGYLGVDGPEPDGARLREAANRLEPARVQWWRTRLAQAWDACDPAIRERVSA